MFELLNTGMMAHKLGKWRGLITVGGAALLFFLASLVTKMEDLILFLGPKQVMTAPSISALGWMSIGFLVGGCLLLLWACWQLYRDHVHGDHHLDAEIFKDRGW